MYRNLFVTASVTEAYLFNISVSDLRTLKCHQIRVDLIRILISVLETRQRVHSAKHAKGNICKDDDESDRCADDCRCRIARVS